MTTLLRAALATGTVPQTRLGDLPTTAASSGRGNKLSLVDDDTIEHEILSSRLALAMMDRASWEFTDLRSRMNVLEGREELDTNDILRPHVLARIVTTLVAGARRSASTPGGCCSRSCTTSSRFSPKRRTTRPTASCCSATCCPRSTCGPSSGARPTAAAAPRRAAARPAASARRPACRRARRRIPVASARAANAATEVGEETRLMTRAAGLARGNDQADAVLGRLNRLVGRQLPDFAVTAHARRRRRRA